jgi:hypothetical protein
MKISFFSFLFSLNHILLNCHSFPAIINYIINTKQNVPKPIERKPKGSIAIYAGLELTNRLASLCWNQHNLLARRRKAAEEEGRKQQQQKEERNR